MMQFKKLFNRRSLNANQLAELKDRLLTEEKEVSSKLGKLNENIDFGSDTDHFDEEADEAEEFANRLGVKKVLENQLERIKAALERFKQNTYGTCERCGKEITYKLLVINPESTLCQNCKSGV
ncbi:TraR/DksA C4-type zinc finger protein [Candidatus Jorgensenbacteria bacterium]|nr:TraR/DksA C4-type zinc finger protein [Candidatus Jorgensenbacteria bacterium]